MFVDFSVSCFVFPRPSPQKTDWKVFLLLRRKDPLAIKENRRQSLRRPVVLEKPETPCSAGSSFRSALCLARGISVTKVESVGSHYAWSRPICAQATVRHVVFIQIYKASSVYGQYIQIRCMFLIFPAYQAFCH